MRANVVSIVVEQFDRLTSKQRPCRCWFQVEELGPDLSERILCECECWHERPEFRRHSSRCLLG